MRKSLACLLFGFASLALAITTVHAQTTVHFASLDGPPATELDGYLFPASGAQATHPAVVFLHGCGGMFSRSGKINARERDWAQRMNEAGITVLMVDSLGPRHHGEMCAPAHFDARIYRARPLDAYAALRYLQAMPNVRADRIAVVGWSQGGGTVLHTIRGTSPARPASLPQGDFRAAVAFYPGSCNPQQQGAAWSSSIPLLLLIGAKDVWTPLGPCEELMKSLAPPTSVSLQIYANAYHDFDWPNMPIHAVPAFKTRSGVVPIEGTDEPARGDAQVKVMAFLRDRLLAP